MMRRLVLLPLGLLGGAGLLAEPVRVTIPETAVHEFVSTHTGRHYQLRLGLPRNYDPERRTYPVIYQLDAQWDFDRVWMMSRALEYDRRLGPMIVCGITYAGDNPDYGTLRQHDYTPTDFVGGGASGDADTFLRTVREEVIPLVESNYAVDASERVLMGSSYGGLFTGYALLHAPDLFTGFVMSSPSFWVDNRVMVELARQRGGDLAGHGIKARIRTGAREAVTQRLSAQAFYDELHGQNLVGLDLALVFEADERHGAVAEMAYLKDLPAVMQPRLVAFGRGDGRSRGEAGPARLLGWTVDVLETSVDPQTGVRRRVQVKDPASPQRSTYAYGMVYVMDAQWDFRFINAHYGALVYDFDASGNVVQAGLDWAADSVAELMTWREQEFAGPKPEGAALPAGMAAYRRWVAERARPAAESALNAPPGYRMLIASERAALWAMTDLMSEEPLFDRYLLVEPAAAWDEDWLLALEEARAARGGALDARVLIYTGDAAAGAADRSALEAWVTAIRARNYTGFVLERETLTERGYAQAKFEGYHKGLRRLIR